MTMMESFPRGRRARDTDESGAGGTGASSRDKRKRDTTTSTATTETPDNLFGDAATATKSSSSKKKKKIAANNNTFALPLGGGHVVHKGNSSNNSSNAIIEALSFNKLAKGTKLLGIVREVHDDFCLIALPNLLTGYVLPPTKPDVPPLSEQLTVGQVLAVYVMKIASEPVGKGKHQVMRRRIQLSVEPHHLNAILADDTDTYNQHELLRGRIASVEDHGVLVDLGNGQKGFCKFVNVSDKTLSLNEGRVHDFSLEDKSKSSSTRMASLCLSADTSKRHLPSTYHPTLQDLKPGSGLVNCKIEAVAKNGLLVSFGIFRGAIHVNHLGGFWVPSNKQDDEWKTVFTDSIHNVPARIIAVDARTKVIRLSLQPHLLHLTTPPPLPPVGTVVTNATVIRLDPGIGALLSLPPRIDENKTKLASTALSKNHSYRTASLRPAAYVHISKATSSRISEADFAKDYAPSTQHTLRILATTNWVEGIATAATATDTVDAHVLQHSDLVPGAIYRNVPVLAQLDGGSVLVDFGMGIKGLIPALQLFDASTNTSSDYRMKLRKEKFAVDKKVDVRVLTVDTVTKKCMATAKKSLLKAGTDIFDDYSAIEVGNRATGYISKVDGKGIYVTFYNRVYGRVTARSLAAELGVEDHKMDYSVGDVVKCRVISCRRRVGKNLNSYVNDDIEEVDHHDDGRSGYWDLNLSLHVGEGDDDDEAAMEKARNKSRRIQLQSGAVLPAKSMKIVELMPSIDKKRGDGFIPGHAIVRIKSKFIMKKEDVDALPYVECKVPFDQILDSYKAKDRESKEAMDAFAKEYFTVGKKIDKPGLILSDPKKSSDEYASGIGKLPIVSLRPTLIETAEKLANKDDDTEKSLQVLIPTADTNLYMGAYVQGFVHQADPRHGAFVRFLDDVTGLVPKLKKGNTLTKWDTVTCKIVALDVTCQPPKILLQRATPGAKDDSTNKLIVKPGDVIKSVEVLDVNFSRANLQILDDKLASNNMIRARVHVTMADSSAIAMPKRRKGASTDKDKETIRKGHPFYKWKKGKTFKDMVCVSSEKRFGVTFVELSTRPVAVDDKTPVFVNKPAELQPGMSTSGIIVGIAKSKRGLWVQPSPGLNCFIPALELSEDADVLNEMESYFPMGARLNCRVMDKDAWKKKKNWGVRVPKLKSDDETKGVKDAYVPFLSVLLEQSKKKDLAKVAKPTKGKLLVGRVNRSMRLYRAPSLMLELRGGFHGRCCITELEEPDEWVNMPLGRQQALDAPGAKQTRVAIEEEAPPKDDDDSDSDDEEASDDEEESNSGAGFEDGEFVQCRVLERIPGEPVVEVSLRQSRLEGDLDDDELPLESDLANAFVVDTNKKGCFLRLSRKVDGRVILKNIADGFLKEPEVAFPMGRLVVGRVMKIRDGKKTKKNIVSNNADVDMRESVIMEGEDKLTFEEVKVDEKYKGIVARVEDYGVFVRLDNSDISGLVHMSECSDAFTKSIHGLYDPGDLVKVLVIKKDEKNKKFGFSMKASHFEGDEDSDDESMEDDDDEEMEEAVSDNEDGDSDDENFVSKMAAKMKTGDDDSDDESSDDSDDDSGDESDDDDETDTKAKAAMDTDVGFNWGAAPADKAGEDEDESDDDSESDDSEDEATGKSGHNSRKKAAARRQEELAISKREKALADGTADENPETSADFERLLAGEPNNSELWIRYMAYYLSLADMDGCRRVAKRAFERIDFRQEGEKLNVWTALLTMELKFGGDFEATIDRACGQNNPKQVYLRVCELLEKEVDAGASGGEAVARANNMYQKMCKKFRSKKTVWIAHLAYLLKHGRHQAAHALLKRALLSLPEYKHIETMSKFAQLEFEHGSVERGRTVFDGILSKYPKRLDLLFVFVDKEVKAGELVAARSLLKRTAESSNKLTDKQMKKLFRKWMKMEEELGTDESQENVKNAARAYVERTSK